MTTTTATAATTAAPALDARVIGLAHYAGRAHLEAVLARHGATFNQSVTLRVVVTAGGSIGLDELVRAVTGALKAEESLVLGVIGELTAAKLLAPTSADPSRLRITDAGRELFETTTAETAGISARLYADIPAEDLAVAGRVLALITERANAELSRS